MPLRIAILCEYPTLNGGERSLLACVDQLSAADIDFTFLAPQSGPLAEELSQRRLRHVPFDRHADRKPASRDQAIGRLVELCSRDCNLLHANSLAMGRLTGAAAAQLTVPCTAHLRDIIKLGPAAIADLNRNAQLVAVSHAVRKFHAAQGVAGDRVAVIHNGIDCTVFHPGVRTNWLRRELKIDASAFLVATIGQICLRKGQDVFAESAVRIAGSVPHAHFVIVGTRHSTKAESVAFEAAITARFEYAGVCDRLHLLGERQDVPLLLREIDVLVHASRQEPFGRVLLEAAAAGVPIVATDVGGTREILTDGQHALLVLPDDPHAITDAVVRLASHPELAAAMRHTAREHVADRFPIERAAAELHEFWHETIAELAR